MVRVVRSRLIGERRSVAYALGAAALILVVVAGFVFVDSTRVGRVTDNAIALHWTNATTGTAALTRAGLVQAITFGELEQNGLVEPGDFAYAMDQVVASSRELEQLFEVGEGHESYPALARFVTPVRATVEDLEAGAIASAKRHITGDVETTYTVLVDALAAEQNRIHAAIEDNSADGREVNAWILFIVTLVVPGSAVGVYYLIARRQMRAMQERNRLEVEAERTISRAKDMFIAGLSHELRTPLTSIYGYAEVLADGDIKGVEAVGETARTIASEAAEMTRMVDDLLVASRLGSTGVEIDLALTDVGSVVEAALTPFIRAGMSVGWDPTSAFVVTDGPRLRQVLVNLVSNASRHGGENVGVGVTRGDGVVEVEVWDDGDGVPEPYADRLFDPFVHRGEAPLVAGSVGLGLAVASQLTELLGGELDYQRYGARTYFVVRLPAPDPSVSGESSEEPESVAAIIKTLSS